MKALMLSDFRVGDVISFKKAEEPEGTRPARCGRRIGRVLDIDKGRDNLLVDLTAVIDGIRFDCRWWVKPAEVIGFHVPGVPL